MSPQEHYCWDVTPDLALTNFSQTSLRELRLSRLSKPKYMTPLNPCDHFKWLIVCIPGKVVKVTGPLSYHIELLSGQVVRRHVDAICARRTLIPRLKLPPINDSTADDFFLPDLQVPLLSVPHTGCVDRLDNVQLLIDWVGSHDLVTVYQGGVL